VAPFGALRRLGSARRERRAETVNDDEQRGREDAAGQLWDALALSTEHHDITRVQAFRKMCEATVKVYDGTSDQRFAEWAREALRLLDERDA
jgi:hypothetical protein